MISRLKKALLLVLLLSACSEEIVSAPPPTDSWYRPIDNPAHEFTELPRFIFSPVKPELIDEAAAALSDGPLLQLSTYEAQRYATNELRTMRELRPFLIYALYRSKRLFKLSIADRALWVDSLDEPDDLSPIRRQPLVVYIDEVPPDVYVTVGLTRARALAEAAKKAREHEESDN